MKTEMQVEAHQIQEKRLRWTKSGMSWNSKIIKRKHHRYDS